jgi:catechol 2,3-dioxygenase-like lactoylglutathione lyase family enzyme
VDDAGEPIGSISAVTLLTADMASAVAFYSVLGLRQLYGGPASEFTSFRVGDGYLNLQVDPSRAAGAPIWGRVVLWVADVDATYATLIQAGYVAESEPADASWGERYFHIRDPDGHEISLARPLTSG